MAPINQQASRAKKRRGALWKTSAGAGTDAFAAFQIKTVGPLYAM